MANSATVLTGRNNIFTVRHADGDLLCRIKGKVLELEERAYNPLAPGDLVLLEDIDLANGSAVIAGRMTRKNEFGRYNHKRDSIQTLAANIDQVVCLMSVHQPAYRRRFVDRVLVLCEYYEIPATIIVTKSDLAPNDAASHIRELSDLGYAARATSITAGDTRQTGMADGCSHRPRQRHELAGT